MDTNSLIFDEKQYAQCEGMSMGSPPEPLCTNVYMSAFERKLMQKSDSVPSPVS